MSLKPNPDYRTDLFAFIRDFFPEGLKMAEHHASIFDVLRNSQRQKGKNYRDEEVKFTGFSMDPGKPGGDHTAYVRYSYDGITIHIDELSTEELYEDYDDCARGQRPSIADLVARIGQRRCNCNAGYLIREDTRQLVVCTRCDGFSTQRGRRFRTRR